MATETVAVPTLEAENSVLREKLAEAIKGMDDASYKLVQLRILLDAALKADPHAMQTPLLEIAQHVASDWGNAVDCHRENLQEWLDARPA